MLRPQPSLRALEREAREGLALPEALAGGGVAAVNGWEVRRVPGGVLVIETDVRLQAGY